MSFCRHNNPASSGGALSSRPPGNARPRADCAALRLRPPRVRLGRALRVTSLSGDETSTAQEGISRPVPLHEKPRQTGALPPFRRCPATARPRGGSHARRCGSPARRRALPQGCRRAGLDPG
jgi:hypothetical protein